MFTMRSTMRYLLLGCMLCCPALAQVSFETPRGTWVSPLSGREYNNPISATLDSHIIRSQQQQQLFNQMNMNEMFNEQWRKIGRQVIADGKATVALADLDAAMAGRVAKLRNTPEVAKPVEADFALAREVAAARHVDVHDSANLIALAMIVAYERGTDRPATPKQLQGIANDLRPVLMIDPILQGQGAIGRELQAAKFAGAIAGVERLARVKDPAAREAGRSVLKSLWPDPVDAIEPTDDGFIDRGRRIVKENAGTSSFKPVTDDRAVLEKQAASITFVAPYLVQSDPDMKRADDEQRKQWIDARLVGLTSFRESAKSFNLPDNDLATTGTVAVARLWPHVDSNRKTPDVSAIAKLQKMFETDVKTDPSFQRLADEARQEIARAWTTRAIEAETNIRAADGIDALKKKLDAEPDPLGRLTIQSQMGVLESTANQGRSQAIALLRDLFSPRKLESIELTDEGFVELKK